MSANNFNFMQPRCAATKYFSFKECGESNLSKRNVSFYLFLDIELGLSFAGTAKKDKLRSSSRQNLFPVRERK